jgi:hypothetical protein
MAGEAGSVQTGPLATCKPIPGSVAVTISELPVSSPGSPTGHQNSRVAAGPRSCRISTQRVQLESARLQIRLSLDILRHLRHSPPGVVT